MKTKTTDQSPEEFYRRVKRQWGIVDEPGLTLLSIAKKCLTEMQAYEVIIATEGAIVLDRFHQAKANPACMLLKESRAHFLQTVKSLNLDLESLDPDAKKA